MDNLKQEHLRYTRRYFAQLVTGGAVATLLPGCSSQNAPTAALELGDYRYLTMQEMFGTVERGKPLPYKLAPKELAAAGLTPETWKLEIVSDPDAPAILEGELRVDNGTAFTFADLKKHAEKHAVSYLKTLTCANGSRPLGTGLWEGVPLRDIVLLTGVNKNFRRLWYHGFHNHDAKQMFRSSLSADRLFEDPLGTPPVILAYRLNGEAISGKRGGPVRLIVPEAYGFKNIKWVNRIILSNRFTANDTYEIYNNTTESWLKSLARFGSVPEQISAGDTIPLSGIAQVGTAGLIAVEVLVKPGNVESDHKTHWKDDQAWQRTKILRPPTDDWGGRLPANRHPGGGEKSLTALGFSAESRQPQEWPMRFTTAHWATVLSPLKQGTYTAFCRTIDRDAQPQPWPRKLQNSGRNRLHRITFEVAGA